MIDATNVLGDGIGSVEHISTHGSDKWIVNTARTSNGKEWDDGEFTDKDYRLLKYLLRHEHGSPFEHNQLVFHIKAPLYIHSQWVKHRIGTSINTKSGRYTPMGTEFYIPTTFRQQATENKQGSISTPIVYATDAHILYSTAIQQAVETYQSLLDLGVSKEIARGILPECTYTEFIFTCNLRSLLHFLHLRDDEHAQWEIQQYAKVLRQFAAEQFPHTFRAIDEIGGINHV